MNTNRFLLGVLFCLFIVACSKKESSIPNVESVAADTTKKVDSVPIVKPSVDTTKKPSRTYVFADVDSSDYNLYVGTDTGGVKQVNPLNSPKYIQYPIRSLLRIVSDSIVVSDTTIVGYKDGDVNLRQYYKRSDSALLATTRLANIVTAPLVGSLDSANLRLTYSAYYVYDGMVSSSSVLNLGSLGYTTYADLFRSGGFFDTPHKMYENCVVSWINVKIRYKYLHQKSRH